MYSAWEFWALIAGTIVVSSSFLGVVWWWIYKRKR